MVAEKGCFSSVAGETFAAVGMSVTLSSISVEAAVDVVSILIDVGSIFAFCDRTVGTAMIGAGVDCDFVAVGAGSAFLIAGLGSAFLVAGVDLISGLADTDKG